LSKLSSYQMRSLFVIVRMTWGWQKESDTISHKQISDMTGIDRRNIFRILERLADRRIVAIHRDGRKAPTYRINKSIAQWRLPSSRMAAPKRERRRLGAVPLNGSVPSSHMAKVPSPQTAELPCEETRSEESSKEKKENERKTALRAASSYDGSLKDSDSEEEASNRKELSSYRNKMVKSGMYKPEEWAGLLDKTLEQLREIDAKRFADEFEKKRASS
jgi:phage replication O-like protein O